MRDIEATRAELMDAQRRHPQVCHRPRKSVRINYNVILSCPPAGPTTAYESLFSDSRHGENFVFHFCIRSAHRSRACPTSAALSVETGNSRFRWARLEGWQRIHAVHPSFETACCARLLRVRSLVLRTLESRRYSGNRAMWEAMLRPKQSSVVTRLPAFAGNDSSRVTARSSLHCGHWKDPS
jgi:hypothetical protein